MSYIFEKKTSVRSTICSKCASKDEEILKKKRLNWDIKNP